MMSSNNEEAKRYAQKQLKRFEAEAESMSAEELAKRLAGYLCDVQFNMGSW